MIELRKAGDRGRTELEWLESRHSFSFAHFYDPRFMGHGPLRVINEDWIAPRSGFPSHPHRDMEILTYMLSGTLTHRDSEGSAIEIAPGRIQRMHAGRGIVHSELNFDRSVPVHLLQIWIEPDRAGIDPGHTELDFDLAPGEPTVLASPGGARGGVSLQQDATLSALSLEPGRSAELVFDPARRGWIQVARGSGSAQGVAYEAGDGLRLERTGAVEVSATAPAELLIFDLP